MTERDWRDSNAPKWVKDAAEAELTTYKLTASLSWPTEARPSPEPFRWGDYDRLTGTPVPGVYYSPWRGRVEVGENSDKIGSPWKSWKFKIAGEWSTCVTRGPLFSSEHDAALWRLWDACEDAAKELMELRDRL